MDLVAVIISGLAGWRIASLFLTEAGPWSIFEHFRKFIGIKPGKIEGFFPLLFTCVYCLSIYTAALSYAVYTIFPEIVIIGAASTVVIMVDRLMRE